MMHQYLRFFDSLLKCSAATSKEKLTVGYIRVGSSLGKCNHTLGVENLGTVSKSQRFL